MIEKKNVTGEVALNYLKNELSRGGAFSTIVNELPLSNGDIYALVPEETPDIKLYDFANGGIYPIDQKLLPEEPYSTPILNDARPTLVDIICQYLNSGNENCCLFEDQLRSPSYPIVTVSAIEYVHLKEGQMFYFFNSRKDDTAIIKKTLKASEAHVFLCALSSLDVTTQNEFLPNKEISLELLKKFAKGVSMFFVMAYDYEGYLMWTRK